MATEKYENWKVITACQLNTSATKAWELVGGFYNLDQWHPDITKSEVQDEQSEDSDIVRKLTIPGQSFNWEQLVFLDNENMRYKYKWYKGEWGEMVQKYHSQIQIIETVKDKQCSVQWSSSFYYYEDGLTQFYHNGFESLIKMFGGKLINN